MKQGKLLRPLSFLLLSALIFFSGSVPVYAGHVRGRRPGIEKKTVIVKRAPRGPFRWHKKGFYRRPQSGLRIDLSVGRIVVRLPFGFRRIVYRGRPYFYCQGVYYAHSPQGYVIVEPPYAGSIQKAADTVEIYIPNANGSYTVVELARSGTGYIGPQGEYYPEHPTVAQLVTLYGK